jgi:hypothetical protein
MDISRRRSVGRHIRQLCGLIALTLALTAGAQAQNSGLFRGGDLILIDRGGKIVWRFDSLAFRNSMLQRIIDSALAAAPAAGAGRTYLRDLRPTLHAGLGNIDSSGALYSIEFNYGTLNYQGYTNFSNQGSSGGDSAQFQMNGLVMYGFMLPLDAAYPVKFERLILKTNYGASTDAAYSLSFPENYTGSPDSTLFSVHIKTEYIATVRYYYIRIYKHVNSAIAGLSIPIGTGTLVCSHSIPADRFPLYGTSVQIRFDMWIRRF